MVRSVELMSNTPIVADGGYLGICHTGLHVFKLHGEWIFFILIYKFSFKFVTLLCGSCKASCCLSLCTPRLMEAVAGGLSFERSQSNGRFSRLYWRRFVTLLLSPKLKGRRTGRLFGTAVASSCLIYERCWFSPVCLPGPVIHEWTQTPEPAIVKVHWE